MATVAQILANAKTSPQFRKLSYTEQQLALKKAIDDNILQDPTFTALPDTMKAGVYQAVIQNNVMKWTPMLNSFEGGLTDQDRMLMDQSAWGLPGTQDSYKRGLYILERMDKGDPTAADQAKAWITGNGMKTSSTLVQLATGAKDVIETLFTGDKPLNSLAVNSQDYYKLADAMYARMNQEQAQSTRTVSGIASGLTRMTEVVALNTIFVGNIGMAPLAAKAWPGIFTNRMWQSMTVKSALATTVQGQELWGTLIPGVADAVLGGGVTDLVRDLPNLIETGRIQGSKAFWSRAATTFGEGIAFDLTANIMRTTVKYAAHPLKAAIRSAHLGLSGNLSETAESLKDAAGHLDTDRVVAAVNDAFTGNVNGELIEALPEDVKSEYYKEIMRIRSMMDAPDFDPNSTGGFKILSKAMGFDVDIDEDGLIHVIDDSGTGKEFGVFKTKPEAVEFYRSMNWTSLDTPEAAENALTLGGSQNVRAKIYAKTRLSVKDLPTAQLYDSIGSGLKGFQVDQETVASSIKELGSRAGTTVGPIKFIDENDWLIRQASGTLEANDILLPNSMTKVGTRESVMDYLKPVLKGVDPGFSPEALVGRSLSADSLNAAMQRIGGSLEVGGPGYRMKLPDGSLQEFRTLGEANRQVWSSLLDLGLVSPEEYGNLIYRSTGLTLKIAGGPETDGGPIRFELWGRDSTGKGVLRQYANSMEELAGFASAYEVKLPDFLMPDLIIRNGKVTVGETFVAGPFEALRRFAGDFDTTGAAPDLIAGNTVKRQLADGSWASMEITNGKKFVQVEWPDYGVSKQFSSLAKANEFFDQIHDGYDALTLSAARKGLRVQFTNAGTYILSNGTDYYAARTLDEAKGLLQSIPDRFEGKDLVKFFSPTEDSMLASAISDKVDEIAQQTFSRPQSVLGAKLATGKSVWRNNLEAAIRPAQAYIDDAATRFGVPELAEAANATVTGRRLTETVSNRLKTIVKEICTDDATGQVLPEKDLQVITRLLQIDPGERVKYADSIARNLGIDFVYGPAQQKAVNGLEAFYGALKEPYGIDPLMALKNYSPNVRDFSDPDQLSELLKLRRDEIAQRVFHVGKFSELPELEFLSRNSRLDAVINAYARGNALEIADMYIDNGTRELYLGPIADKFRKTLADLSEQGALTGTVLEDIKQSYLNLIGGGMDKLGEKVAETSLDITTKLAHGLNAVSREFGGDSTALGSAIEKMASNAVSTDIPSRLSDIVTQSTMGFKFSRLLTNSAQVVNTWAAYGKYATDAIREVDDAYVQELWERGLLDEKIFAAVMDAPSTTLREVALMPNQVSEFLTRAWTAKAQEDAFNEAFNGLAAGRLSLDQFVNLARMDYFPTQSLSRIVDLVKEGSAESIAAARDQAMKQAIRSTMFDMAREDWPSLFQTTLGRVFGKFGVYPAGQLEFYRSLATRGNWVNRTERVLRLVAGMAIIKNAFQIAGIDYDGFNITDPLAFSGSPLWNSLIDLTKVGSSGLEGDLARHSLQRNWLPVIYSASKGWQPNIPRLAFPGAAEVNSIAKGIGDWNAGVEPWGVLLDFMGAPRMTQPWNGVQMPW